MQHSGTVLIAYATRYGSTAEVARFIARVLADAGLPTELLNVEERSDIEDVRALILGTPIRMEKPLPEILRFARDHGNIIGSVPCYVFSLGAWMRNDTAESRDKTRGFLQPLLDITGEPAALAMFGGRIDYDLLSFMWRMVARRDDTGLMAEGDGRSWDEILAWSKSIAADLTGEEQ
jgi:menaquinone-dependent protoporphyrinogen oxidase